MENIDKVQNQIKEYSQVNIFIIELTLSQAEVYLMKEELFHSFKMTIDDISDLINQYKSKDFESISENEKYFLFLIQNQYLKQKDIDNRMMILESKFLMLSGVFQQIIQNDKQSASFYYSALTRFEIYDPSIRELCLQQLKLIFHQQEQT